MFAGYGELHAILFNGTMHATKITEKLKHAKKTTISGIIGHANMLLGKDVDEVLERHLDIGGNLFKGIRHAGSWDSSDMINISHHNPPKDMYLMKEFGEGLKILSG